MGLEERRREQSEETSVETEQHCCRYRGILEQEIHHDLRNPVGVQVYGLGLKVWSVRERGNSPVEVRHALWSCRSPF